MARMTMVKALNLALREALRDDPNVVILGEDVGKDEGVFRVTEGLWAQFGDKRVIDTPVSESAIAGAAVGMCFNGLRPICEMQFSGFGYHAFHQIENHVSRYRNRTRGRLTCPMVIRMPYGGGIRAIEHHSESREAIYVHLPGLKVVVPSGPRNARALLRASILDPDPVIFYEPKAVYRSFQEEVPEEPETLPLGKAQIVREGDDVTLISYGASLRPTVEASQELADEHGIDATVIDLMTLSPMDTETIVESIRHTGRAVVVHEAPRTCGVGSEIVARVVEHSLEYLEAPIRRVTGYDVIIPYFSCEKDYLPDAGRIIAATKETVSY